jgi:hypothetical protein
LFIVATNNVSEEYHTSNVNKDSDFEQQQNNVTRGEVNEEYPDWSSVSSNNINEDFPDWRKDNTVSSINVNEEYPDWGKQQNTVFPRDVNEDRSDGRKQQNAESSTTVDREYHHWRKKEHVLPSNNVNKQYPNWRKQQNIVKNESVKKNDLISKFRSLSEIKDGNSGWQKLKDNSVISKKLLMAAGVITLVIALGFFRNSFNERITASSYESNSTLLDQRKTDEAATPANKDSLNIESDYLPDASFFNDQMNQGKNENTEITSLPNDTKVLETPILNQPSQPQEKEQRTDNIKEQKTNNKKDEAIVQTSTSQPAKKEEAASDRNDETAGRIKQNEPVLQTASSKTEKPAVPLTRLINISGDYLPSQKGDGVNGYRVTMRNNSDQVLKVVAVDVFYYGANDKLLTKKTLYFNNVAPRANMILTAPSNKDAVVVNHQLGLVSSAEGALYFVKQE